MKIDDFYCMLAVAKNESICKGAQSLFIAQPALSRKIAAIEAHYHVKLFQRTSQGTVPSEAGKVFLQHAMHIVSEYEQLQADMTSFTSGLHGKVIVSYVPLVGQPRYLVDTFRAIKRNHPSLDILPRKIFAMEAVPALDRHEIDCCLVSDCYIPADTDLSLYECTFIHRMRPYFLLSRFSSLAAKASISFRDMEGRLLVITNNRSVAARKSNILRSCELAGCKPPELVLANDLEETLLILRMQDACALSAIAIDDVIDPIKDIVTVPIEGYAQTLNRVLMWRKDNPNPCLPIFRDALLLHTAALRWES